MVTRFSAPWDCDPLLPLPVWVGILISLFLAAILLWAIQVSSPSLQMMSSCVFIYRCSQLCRPPTSGTTPRSRVFRWLSQSRGRRKVKRKIEKFMI